MHRLALAGARRPANAKRAIKNGERPPQGCIPARIDENEGCASASWPGAPFMTIRFKCPHCQKTLGVKDHLAGKKANCPACKKLLRIPAPPPAPVAPTPAPHDVEAAAASVFSDEPAQAPVDESAPTTITFTCNWCDEEVTLPADVAGKQAQCPNPDCRRIVKVPQLQVQKKIDWRDAKKKGPTLARENQLEKLDGVMGSPDDKGKVSQKALIEAGVVALPKKPGIGVRGWIRRGMMVTAAAGVFAILGAVGYRLHNEHEQKKVEKEVLPSETEMQQAKYAPAVVSDYHRSKGVLHLRSGKFKEAYLDLESARGDLTPPPTDKAAAIDRDMHLIDLALTQLELGGSEEEKIAKEKHSSWKEMPKILQPTLDRIMAPEARAWAMRELGTRLIERKQGELAIGLAAQTAKSQLIAFGVKLDQKKLLEQQPKEPDLNRDVTDAVARCGYAEGYARKGKEGYEMARTIATAKGPPRDQLDALVGVAAVIVSASKDRLAEAAEARPFLEEALRAVESAVTAANQKRGAPPSPWVLLQLLRVAARVDAMPKLDDLLKQLSPALPVEFRPRAELEAYLARLDKEKEPLSPKEVEELFKNETMIALALEATARQHAWLRHGQDDVIQFTAGERARYLPVVKLGLVMGQRFGRP